MTDKQSEKAIFYKKRKIGRIHPEKNIYVSYRNRNHIFRKFNGFGLSTKLLDFLDKNKVENIIINFENKKTLQTSSANFLINGIPYNDNGDEQLILEIKHFNKKNTKEKQAYL